MQTIRPEKSSKLYRGITRSLIKRTPCSQALHLEKICTKTPELSKDLQVLKRSFISRGINEKFLDTEFQRLPEIDRNALLAPKLKEKDQIIISFVTTYNKTLPNAKQIIIKHWHLLQINSNLRTAFGKEPNIAYRRNKNIGDLISSVKWTVLAHLESQPRGQNFQTRNLVDRSSPSYTRFNKILINTFIISIFIKPNPKWARTVH